MLDKKIVSSITIDIYEDSTYEVKPTINNPAYNELLALIMVDMTNGNLNKQLLMSLDKETTESIKKFVLANSAFLPKETTNNPRRLIVKPSETLRQKGAV